MSEEDIYTQMSYIYIYIWCSHMGFPDGSDNKESAYCAGDLGSIPRLGRSPEERNGYLL